MKTHRLSVPFVSALLLILVFLSNSSFAHAAKATTPKEVVIVVETPSTPKIDYGVELLAGSLKEAGVKYRGPLASFKARKEHVIRILIDAPAVSKEGKNEEGFTIVSAPRQTTITGHDDAGALYGCKELAARIRASRGIPQELNFADAPKMTLRGVPLFLMTAGSYDFPITPQQFPWFFDKALWTKTLDFFFENRFNFISFWNGHPFPYFVKLPKYPEVKELSDAELERNVELLDWLSNEAAKRNIWLLFQFYNIHLPKSYALAHGIPHDDAFNGYTLSKPNPEVAAYTRYAIGEFIKKYPSVGLVVCAGERLEVQKEEWTRDVIIAGVRDSGREPPIVVREWTIDKDKFRDIILPSYPNLYTEMKQNSEMYAAIEPDPDNADWIKMSRKHIINVHLMGNIKPFRYAPTGFIRETVGAQQRMGAQGVQVYPLWVWDWPYSADAQQLFQIDRDWLWYAAWARYGWNADRPADQEDAYWGELLSEKYGAKAAPHILAAYEAAGRVMPWVPRMFWFDGWNHWFASNGLTLDQVLAGTPIPYTNLPHTLSVREYARDMADGKPVAAGALTPVSITADMVAQGGKAVAACQQAQPLVEKNADEFARLCSDVRAISLIALFYHTKIDAAIRMVAYQTNRKAEDSQEVVRLLTKSVEDYRELVKTTEHSYKVANDIRNDIPFPFFPPTGMAPMSSIAIPRWPHWKDFLPVFEAELEVYRKLLAGN